MQPTLADFTHDETAAVSVDWIVLTAVLVGTGLAVTSTVRTGVENGPVDSIVTLQGYVMQQSFGAGSCERGLDGVQDAEARRVADGAEDGVDVMAWRAANLDGLADHALEHELARKRARLRDARSAEATEVAIMQCELVLRGLG
jgi:hypothetical protein